MLKFGIGTSQNINKYGILKKSIKKKDFINIIKKKNKKIDLIDTAPSYGKAEKIINRNCNSNYKIITKFNKINSKNYNDKFQELRKGFEQSLKNLNNKKVYAILFHNDKDIDILKDRDIKKKFSKLIKNSKIKVGFSTYSINKIEKKLKIFKFNIVQVPINPFSINRKNICLLKKLKKKYKFEVHARSLFLQGLGLQKVSFFTKKFELLKKKIVKIDEITKKYKISRYNFFLSLIASLKVIDYGIIGISNIKDFNTLKKNKLIKIKNEDLYKFEIENKKIVDPRFWS